MKKKSLLIMMFLSILTACNIKNNNAIPNTDEVTNTTTFTSVPITSTQLITEQMSTETTVTTYTIPPSYEEISHAVEEYFRMFYENNINYKCNSVETTTERSTNGSYIIGYFDNDSLVKLESEYYGESRSIFTTYYFINENLTYLVHRTNYQWPQPRQEEYHNYFLIDGVLWQYDYGVDELIESTNLDVIKYFEQDKNDLFGNKPLSFTKNNHTIPKENNLFVQFSKAKNMFLKSFFMQDRFDVYGDYFHVGKPNYYNYYNNRYFTKTDDVNALFINSKLFTLCLESFDDLIYIGYEYYPIDDTRIYVIVYNQEFENEEIDFNKMKKSYYEEYFIVDDIVMIYDTEKQDLVESPENQDILTYYNTAIEKIED